MKKIIEYVIYTALGLAAAKLLLAATSSQVLAFIKEAMENWPG
ncbi:MAG: hypothetical protein ACYDH2_13800 [Anaerolineaceae bacterium]